MIALLLLHYPRNSKGKENPGRPEHLLFLSPGSSAQALVPSTQSKLAPPELPEGSHPQGWPWGKAAVGTKAPRAVAGSHQGADPDGTCAWPADPRPRAPATPERAAWQVRTPQGWF